MNYSLALLKKIVEDKDTVIGKIDALVNLIVLLIHIFRLHQTKL